MSKKEAWEKYKAGLQVAKGFKAGITIDPQPTLQTNPAPRLESEALKFDGDKPPWDLLDTYALNETAKVLKFGAQKYAPHNWRKGIRYSRLIAASMRHIAAINNGEDTDPETGLPHAAHLMCCAMFLCAMMHYRPDMDDRWVTVLSQPQEKA